MYDDPANIKKHTVKVRLDDFELEELKLVTKLSRGQRASIARKLMIKGIEAFHAENSIGREPKQKGLFNAALSA